MINLSIADIANITGGELFSAGFDSETEINRIVIDSRTYLSGQVAVFFALIGPRNNGHNYIPDLLSKGLTHFIVSDQSVITSNGIFVLVKDTTTALHKLAEFNRKKYNYPVVGITGSNGKTVIKEWVHHILSTQFKVVRNPKSYNSQIGVPLSVLLMNANFNLAVFEAGISQVGEMSKLERIISPEIGIFTTIGDAHQKNFKSFKQKIREKLILFKQSKKLIFNVDIPELQAEAFDFCDRNSIEQISWSLLGNNALISFSTKEESGNTFLKARIKDTVYSFSIPFTDKSSIENACHCFSISWILLKNPNIVLDSFKTLEPIAMRLEIKQGINNCLLINDYYNSDLNSLAIALSVLKQQASESHLLKQVILSDIQQTGIPRNELYKKVNKLLIEWDIDEIIGIGPDISAHSKLFTPTKSFYNSPDDFEKHFRRNEFKSKAILIKGARQFTFEKISSILQQKAHQTVLEINLNALVHNLNIYRRLLKPETKIIIMVKAFSYGSGDVEIAKLLQYQNVDFLAVAVADEGVQLRNAGIQTRIIVMNPELHSFQNMIDYQLEPNIYSIGLLQNFLKIISHNAITNFPVHLKIDTGMNRLGFKTNNEVIAAIKKIASTNWVKIESIFSHLAGSDDAQFDEFTLQQIHSLEEKYELISKYFPYKIDKHILNSSGIERFTKYQFDMVRLGIGLYGVSTTGLSLENVGTLKSTVSQVKTVLPHETVGYSRKGEISDVSKIAVVPLGYADGMDRKLGNKNGHAFINGKRVPIIGNICMDMLMLDVSHTETKPGDAVELFGPNISIEELALNVGTIPYEILTGISQRVKRVYLQE